MQATVIQKRGIVGATPNRSTSQARRASLVRANDRSRILLTGLFIALAFLLSPLQAHAQGCGTGQVSCGGKCSDLSSDASNCGKSGNACKAGQECISGACSGSASCGTGQVSCGGKCSDLSSDASN